MVQGRVIPLLSLQSCLNIKFVKLLYCDTLNTVMQDPSEMPDKKQIPQQRKKQEIVANLMLRNFPDAQTGLETLPGEYHIQDDAAVAPVVHAPRRAPVGLRQTVNAELTHMVADGIIAPVT